VGRLGICVRSPADTCRSGIVLAVDVQARGTACFPARPFCDLNPIRSGAKAIKWPVVASVSKMRYQILIEPSI
jgi:hypothetical protein